MRNLNHNHVCCRRQIFGIFFQLLMIVLISESFNPPRISPTHQERRRQRQRQQNTRVGIVGVSTALFSKADSSSSVSSSNWSCSRRQWIAKSTSHCHTMAIAIILTGLGTLPAHSVTESVDLDSTSAVFEAVRRELTDEDGGVNYLKTKIESGDFAALLEFTKTYDQVLRKGVMGKAKKVLTDSDSKERATAIANNVTFDLIGINRSSRKGQEDITQAKKYLEELQDDIRAFLDLEPKG